MAQGGTGGNTQALARTGLGLGSLATLNGVGDANWTGGAFVGGERGSGAGDIVTARTNLAAAKNGVNSDITGLTALASDLNMNGNKVTGLGGADGERGRGDEGVCGHGDVWTGSGQ